ncbi:MAG: peptidoglycan-N-acetylglucosamine deacetylase [Solirubrobacteraceae bacterium]|nr:peptidoglycan-N-acetylglucosamine deacetylase [Solirubrobacteraceae bacterium]
MTTGPWRAGATGSTLGAPVSIVRAAPRRLWRTAFGKIVPVSASLAGSVALTFDDGPDPVWTPAVLAALRGSPLRATFFVIAPRAVEHPELVAAARAAGHAVELHCYDHVRHTELARADVERDTERALEALADLGVRPTRWRPPYGVEAEWTREVADAFGLTLCGWDLDTNDWRGHAAEHMLAEVGPGLRPGAVVLLHDGVGPESLRDGCEETVRFAQLLAAEAVAA